MWKILIADDEAIECRALEMMIRNDFPDLEILPSAGNGIELIASAKKIPAGHCHYRHQHARDERAGRTFRDPCIR